MRGLLLSTITTNSSTASQQQPQRFNLLLLLKYFFLLAAPIAIPAAISWFYHRDLLRSKGCVLVGYEDHVNLYCRPRDGGGIVTLQKYQHTDAPTLIELSELLGGNVGKRKEKRIGTSDSDGDTASTANYLMTDTEWEHFLTSLQDGPNKPRVVLDYNSSPYYNPSTVEVLDSTGSDGKTRTAYGFRRNRQKHKQGRHHRSTTIPIATGVLLTINIGMYLWLWNHRVDSSQVSLNGQVYQDFGRSLTGNLSHFEIWHVGFNMMTLSSIGPSLEITGGSMPLLLWTISFLPVTTLVVIGLHYLYQLWNSSQQDVIATTNFPSMVGFSGILFAWMVVSTLDGQRSCPVFFLPDLCFDTFELWGGLRISLGPLVQLVVLQVILPRVSFSGHLAGIIVGFIWHWKLFPGLEWFQPYILYPVLWICCKYYCYNRGQTSCQTTRQSIAISDNRRKDDDFAVIVGRLGVIRNSLVLHLLVHAATLGLLRSWTMAELLLIAVLAQLVRDGRQYYHNGDQQRETSFGIVGRAFVFMVMLLLMTDGLTMGAWLSTSQLWMKFKTAGLLLMLRDALFLLSVCLATTGLEGVNETTTLEGTWRLLVWPIARRCFQPVGNWLQKGRNAAFSYLELDLLDYCKQQKHLDHKTREKTSSRFPLRESNVAGNGTNELV